MRLLMVVALAMLVIGVGLLALPSGVTLARLAWSFAAQSGWTPLDQLVPMDPTFQLHTRLDGRLATGVGETSLPDGSRIEMWATYWGGKSGADVSNPRYVLVEHGLFSAQFDLTDWPTGPVAINARFVMDAQQPGVDAGRYGLGGERMYGPRVGTDDFGDRAVNDWQVVHLGS